MNTSGLPPGLAREPQSLLDSVNGDALRRDAPKDSLRQTDGPLYTSVTIPVPKEIQYAISVISSTLDKLAGPVERHHLVPIVIVVCVETAFLKWIRRSNEDVLSTIFFTFLLGSFAWPVWSNLKHIHCRLDDVYGKIEVLQQSMDVLVVSPKANAVDDLHPSREIIPVPSSIDPVSAPAIPEVPFVPPREDHPTSKSLVSPVVKAVDAEPPRPAVDRLVDSNKPPYPPHEIPETIPVHSFNDPVSAPATPKVPFVLPRENPATPKSLVNPVVKAVDPEPPRPAVDLLVDSNKTPYPSHEIPETIPVRSFSDPVSAPATPKVPFVLPREDPPTSKSLVNPVIKAVDPEPPRPAVDRLVDSNKPPYPTHEILETIPVRSLSDPVSAPAIPKVPFVLPREDPPTSKSPVNPVVKAVDAEPPRPVDRLVDSNKPPYPPHKIPASHWQETVKLPAITEKLPPAAPELDPPNGIVIEGMVGNIAGPSEAANAGGSTKPTAPTHVHTDSQWLPALREIKQRIEQFAEGRLRTTTSLNQSESSNSLSIRRCAIRLLMSGASLSPANFASPVGYLGLPESTPYYPTGDLRDRPIAFTIAMDRLDDLDAHLTRNENTGIVTKLLELSQALSDLGLHEYALNTSRFALDTLERSYTATPDESRLQLVSALSLRANILCDLKRNDEAVDTADRAVSLCREHRDSQTTPVPELAYALLNYAVLLNGIGLKDESAGVAFELLGEMDESWSDKKFSALYNLCLLNTQIGADNDMALLLADEAVDLTQTSSDAISQAVLSGALLDKSKILSSQGQNDVALSFSAEAVTLLRHMHSTRPVFSLFLAHALDTHAHQLSEANRKGESYSIRQDAVELWQILKVSAPGAIARPLAWSLFEFAKFRSGSRDRNELMEGIRIAESAVETFREVVPLDAPGLGDALYLLASRLFELDQNREAATYAEESAQNFREALSEDPKYALDLICSLSLASACLTCTERADDAFEYAKQAVEVQHDRMAAGAKDEQNVLLRKLLMDVGFRAAEIDRQVEALPWIQELQALGGFGESGDQSKGDEIKKKTTHRMDPNNGVSGSNNSFTPSVPVANSSALSLDKGKGKEIAYSPEAGRSTSRINDGKGNAVVPLFDPATLGHHLADEEIFSPGAAAQRRLAGLRSTDPPQANIFSAGPRGNDLLSSMLGMSSGRDIDGPSTGFRMGARPTGSLIGSVGSSGLSSSSNRFGGGRLGRLGDLDDMGSLGDGVNGLSSLLGNVSRLGAYTSREGARGAENDGDNNETDNVDSLFIHPGTSGVGRGYRVS